MKPETNSNTLLSITRSKAKMYEFSIPEDSHIPVSDSPKKLYSLSIGLLGDLAASINRGTVDVSVLEELKKDLQFSAHFFDSFVQSKLDNEKDIYFWVLGAATYYLCDLPGSSLVLANKITGTCPDLECNGLEVLLLWILKGDTTAYFSGTTGMYGSLIDNFSYYFKSYIESGNNQSEVYAIVKELRKKGYDEGSDRQLLWIDIINAITLKKIDNSVWSSIPSYSDIDVAQWRPAFLKTGFIKELWPAQHLLGKGGVLKGINAVVQMPTSAGKTKATELIFRASFLSGRSSLSVIVAPFRALCHEIKNSLKESFSGETVNVDELSDVMQKDFELGRMLGEKQIIVVTPEKLLYVLRQNPELSNHIGLLIYDEGHQFDSGSRGITYELLLTSLKMAIPETTQKVLISAVISNAEEIGQWIDKESEVITGRNLSPTYRSLGFVSWIGGPGRIEYVQAEDPNNREFFVPRILEEINIGRRGLERSDRIFPEKNEASQIALYLGIKLVKQGSVALFCGRKSTAISICDKAVDLIGREISFDFPSITSDSEELTRLHYLTQKNLGDSSSATQGATIGIFAHHNNTPQGLRLAVEFAMREKLISFVVCTSTLAQGVNLPIRYLLVSGVYQGKDRLKVRDFHNLIGRAGRAGMHTEGSIIFTDPKIYDKRTAWRDKWRWGQAKELLDSTKSEDCVSNLLDLAKPIKNEDNTKQINFNCIDLVKWLLNGVETIDSYTDRLLEQDEAIGFTANSIKSQLQFRKKLVNSVESFLLAHWSYNDDIENTVELAEQTLAYHLASDEEKELIKQIFSTVHSYIQQKSIPNEYIQTYGRTLYGIKDIELIKQWLQGNIEALNEVSTYDDLIELVWPIFKNFIGKSTFQKFSNEEVLKTVVKNWGEGKSFCEMWEYVHSFDVRLGTGPRAHRVKVEHIVDICEGGVAFDGSLFINVIRELINLETTSDTSIINSKLDLFQKQIRYGLPSDFSIQVYELGFSDRVIAQEFAIEITPSLSFPIDIPSTLRNYPVICYSILSKYPQYYHQVYREL